MLRAAVLSIVILAMVVVTLPMVDSSAHNNSHKPGVSRRSRMNRRHSRAWWRRYRARLRRKRAEQARLQALRTRSVERGRSLNEQAVGSHKTSAEPEKAAALSSPKSSAAPASGAVLPAGWSRRASSAGETRFVLGGQNGQALGEAFLTVVGSARTGGEVLMPSRGQRKTLAGVPVSELRRVVIDKMVAAGGWVVNDFQREIGGKPFFIVTAQTGASTDGRTPLQSWVFFFAESEGRIYSLASKANFDSADRVADEAAQLVASILAAGRPVALR